MLCTVRDVDFSDHPGCVAGDAFYCTALVLDDKEAQILTDIHMPVSLSLSLPLAFAQKNSNYLDALSHSSNFPSLLPLKLAPHALSRHRDLLFFGALGQSGFRRQGITFKVDGLRWRSLTTNWLVVSVLMKNMS